MKNVLVFGSTGYIGNKFCDNHEMVYNITRCSRSAKGNDIYFDFLEPNYTSFKKQIGDVKFDAIIFSQGMNPRVGFSSIDYHDFDSMLQINVISPTILLQTMVMENLSKDACVIFLSSIAKDKGSYDPSYATAKAGLVGLQQSLAKANPNLRFNTVSLGLVDGSPVQQGMTVDFLKKHLDAMNGKLVNVGDVCKTVDFLIRCKSISSQDIKIDCGYRL